jgi:hypothetical protein
VGVANQNLRGRTWQLLWHNALLLAMAKNRVELLALQYQLAFGSCYQMHN